MHGTFGPVIKPSGMKFDGSWHTDCTSGPPHAVLATWLEQQADAKAHKDPTVEVSVQSFGNVTLLMNKPIAGSTMASPHVEVLPVFTSMIDADTFNSDGAVQKKDAPVGRTIVCVCGGNYYVTRCCVCVCVCVTRHLVQTQQQRTITTQDNKQASETINNKIKDINERKGSHHSEHSQPRVRSVSRTWVTYWVVCRHASLATKLRDEDNEVGKRGLSVAAVHQRNGHDWVCVQSAGRPARHPPIDKSIRDKISRVLANRLHLWTAARCVGDVVQATGRRNSPNECQCIGDCAVAGQDD
jgi:hypothetical protein